MANSNLPSRRPPPVKSRRRLIPVIPDPKALLVIANGQTSGWLFYILYLNSSSLLFVVVYFVINFESFIWYGFIYY
jgi:hypothetical protein